MAVLLTTVVGLVPTAAEGVSARTEVYPGKGAAVHIGQAQRPAGTSKAFRKFLQKRLTHQWRSRGGRKDCRPTYVAYVKIWQSKGFSRGKDGQPKDPATFECGYGLFQQVYVKQGGRWKAPESLSTSRPVYGDAPFRPGPMMCSGLRWFEVPGRVAPGRCELDWGPKVRLRDYTLPGNFGTPEYAGAVIAVAFQGSETYVPRLWGTQDVLNEMVGLRVDDLDSFTIDGCGTKDDPAYAPYLAGAPAGCVLDVFYGDYRALYMLGMHPGIEGHWVARSFEGIASS